MPLDFGRNRFAAPGRRKPPPDYLSRRVQWKILLLMGGLMLVIFLMREVQKPGALQWIENLQGGARHPSEPDVDTRLKPSPLAIPNERGSFVIQGETSAGVPNGDLVRPVEERAGMRGQPVQDARREAWSRLLGGLAEDERTVFFKGLKSARDQTTAPEDVRLAWPNLVNRLGTLWQEYVAHLSAAVSNDEADLTDDEKRAWSTASEDLRGEWSETVEPMLQTIGRGVALTEDQRPKLAVIQILLDEVLLGSVRDDTVFRGVESDAWFRLLDELQQRDVADLRRSSVGHVGFLPLYKQPSEYRGKLVTVRGLIYLVQHRQAPANIYGIDGYYIFWLRPTGASSPVVVYSLSVPKGFPDLTAVKGTGKRPVLEEEVEFTGFFFKRWAYRATDATRVAPLILAKTPQWQPAAQPARSPKELPGLLVWTVVIGGTALFGVGSAVLVYWLSRRPSPYQAALTRLEGTLPERVDR